jgi:phospholipase C
LSNNRVFLYLIISTLVVFASLQYFTLIMPSGIAIMPIQHVIVIFKENHTFDNYFGTYPELPNGWGLNFVSDCSYSGPNETGRLVCPYHLSNPGNPLDMNHAWSVAHAAWNHGKMDEFVWAEGHNDTMGYFDGNDIPYYWDYAAQYVLADNYFSSVMGPSQPNHSFLMFGTSWNQTSDGKWWDLGTLIKNETPNVFSELRARGLTFSIYSGAESNPGGPFFSSLENDNLANVTYLIPDDTNTTNYSEHPPGNITLGMDWTVSVVNSIMQSKYWSSSAIFITWDDYGGYYDNVPPPQVDDMGYGFRVPLLVISSYAKQGYIDNTLSDHTSILKFIQTVFNLPGDLNTRDAMANNLLEAFDFNQNPRAPLILPGNCIPNKYPLMPNHCDNVSISMAISSSAGLTKALSSNSYWLAVLVAIATLVSYFGFRGRLFRLQSR